MTLHDITLAYITMNYKYITLHYTLNQTMNFNGKVTTKRFSLYRFKPLYTHKTAINRPVDHTGET